MTDLERISLARWLEHATRAASAVAIAVGIWVLIGWAFDLTLFKSVISGLVAMKPNTALGFILAGISLWHATPAKQPPWSRPVAQVCAALVLLLGLLTVWEYLSGGDFGTGQLLMQDDTDLPGDVPGRMAATTAVSFTALGAALLLLNQKQEFVLAIHVLAIGPILVAGAALLSYVYDLEALLRARLNYTPMALHTAVVFVLLGLGILNARPDFPVRRIMATESAAGSASRLLLPAAIGFPFVSGGLVLRGIQAGYFSEAAGLAVLSVANIAGFSILILWNAVRLRQADTQREQAEQALQDSARRYRELVDNLQEGIWAIDAEHCTTFVNPRMAEMLGYTVDEMQGRHLFTFMDKRSAAIAVRNLERGQQGLKERHEFEFLRKDGTRIWTYLGAAPLFDGQGRYRGALAGITDITARKQLEARLAETSAYTRRLIEVSIDPLVTISPDGKIMDVNAATERATGLAREQLIGSDFASYFTEPDQAHEAYRQALKQGTISDYPLAIRHVSGRVTEVIYSATIFKNEAGDLQGVFAAARDITERKRMEAALEERERYTRRLLAELPTAVVVHAPDSSIRYGNATALKLLGLTADQLVGRTATDPVWHFLRGDGSDMPVEEYPANRVIATRQPVHDYLLGIVQSAGAEPQWVYVNAFPDVSRRGDLREVIVSFVDITEHRRTEQALRDSEARYRSVIAALFEGILLLDADGTIRASNASAERILGLSGDQLAGRTSFDPHGQAIHEDGSPFAGELHPAWVTLQTGRPCHDVIMGTRKPDGSLTWLTVNSQPLRHPEATKPYAAVVSFADITARKHAEEELRALQVQLREAAIHDPLTGLYNRRYMDETLTRELARAARTGRPLSILMCDIDHFKRLNDAYGHQAGDDMLRALADLLHRCTRSCDIPCRYGGEEFLVVLPEMPLNAAGERAEQVLRIFADQRVAFRDTQLGSTLSIGVAAYPDHGTTVDELIGAADQALYAAKQTGRNRVCVARTPRA